MMPACAQRPNHPGRVGPDRVVEEEGAPGLIVDGGEDGQRAVQVGTSTYLAYPRRRVIADNPGGLAEPHPVVADGALQAVAGHLSDVVGHPQGKPATGGGGDDRARQDVRRDLVERGGQSQQLVRVHPVARGDSVGKLRSTSGQCAGLVEEHHLPGGQPFQGAAALDDDAHVCGAGQAGNDRDRGREQQRARRRDDEHGHGADRVRAQRPGRAGENERERDEQDREPIGGADERCRRGLRLLDQAHHTGVGGLRGRRRRDHIDRLPHVDHAAAHVVAGDPLGRPRLARER